MNTTSLAYFIAAAEDLNFTKTAARLFISQQTLSNHILRLEEDCDTTLFNRKPHLSLTFAGEILLDHAKEILLCESNLRQALLDAKNEQCGNLKIGSSTTRAVIFMPHVLPIFREKYPGVTIDLVDQPSPMLKNLVLSGKLDFALGTFDSFSPELKVIPILTDRLFFVVSRVLLEQVFGSDSSRVIQRSAQRANFEDLAALPIIMPNSDTRLHRLILQCYEEVSREPYVYLSTTYIQFFLPLCLQGLVACIVSEMTLSSILPDLSQDMLVFPVRLTQVPASMQLSVIMYKKRHLPAYGYEFIRCLSDYCQFARSYNTSGQSGTPAD